MITRKNLVLVLMLLTLIASASATNITLVTPDDGDSCVVAETITFKYLPLEDSLTECHLYHNDSGSWANELSNYSVVEDQYNFFSDTLSPNTIIWYVECANDTTSFYPAGNFSFVVTDAPYCAVLDEVNCTSYPRIDNYGFFKFRLSNTLGVYLENQDCNIWIENADGIPVETFDTMMYNQQVEVQLDNEGNWININPSKVPLTDSLGWYVFEYHVKPGDWGWYNDNYTIHANCNGQTASCGFQVKEHRAVDTEEGVILLKKFGGMIVVFVCLLVLVVAAYRAYKGRRFPFYG